MWGQYYVHSAQNFINLQSVSMFGPPHATDAGAAEPGLAEEGVLASVRLRGDASGAGQNSLDQPKGML